MTSSPKWQWRMSTSARDGVPADPGYQEAAAATNSSRQQAAPLQTIVAMRWLTVVAVMNQLLVSFAGASWAPVIPAWSLVVLGVVFFTAPGRMSVAALCARLLLRNVEPGVYARGGGVHLRIWFAERLGEAMGADHLSGAAWVPYFARALGGPVWGSTWSSTRCRR